MPKLFKLPAPLNRDSVDPAMPKDGDGVLILRRDGSTSMLTLGMEPRMLMAKAASGAEMTKEEEAQVDVSMRLLALYLAAINPKVMEALMEMASDPTVLSDELLDSLPKLV